MSDDTRNETAVPAVGSPLDGRVRPLVRPVRCHLCGKSMHYSGQADHEPEVRVTVDQGDMDWTFYAHVRCWDSRIADTVRCPHCDHHDAELQRVCEHCGERWAA